MAFLRELRRPVSRGNEHEMKIANLAITRAARAIRTARAFAEMAAHLIDWERARRAALAEHVSSSTRAALPAEGAPPSSRPRLLPASLPAPFDVPARPGSERARLDAALRERTQEAYGGASRDALQGTFQDTMSVVHRRAEAEIDAAVAAAIAERFAREAGDQDEDEPRA